MNRRTVIKNLALVIGGATLLPSCLKNNEQALYQLKHLDITADQEKLIADICETIIPRTNTPGAKDINLHLFVLKMLDDCYNKKDQQAITAGLVDFNSQVKKKYNRSFSDLSTTDKEAFLTGIENSGKAKQQNGNAHPGGTTPQKAVEVPPIDAFYHAVKRETLFGYTTSQYFMTKQIVYELVPGRYNVHFPVKNLKTA